MRSCRVSCAESSVDRPVRNVIEPIELHIILPDLPHVTNHVKGEHHGRRIALAAAHACMAQAERT